MEIVVKLDSCTHYDNGCQSADAVVVVAKILGLSFNPNVRLVVETESTSV